jgi:hypothetical protein
MDYGQKDRTALIVEGAQQFATARLMVQEGGTWARSKPRSPDAADSGLHNEILDLEPGREITPRPCVPGRALPSCTGKEKNRLAR